LLNENEKVPTVPQNTASCSALRKNWRISHVTSTNIAQKTEALKKAPLFFVRRVGLVGCVYLYANHRCNETD
jgi:hypothetical protein